MQRCSASITTPTPAGDSCVHSHSATCTVSRSCTWGRHEKLLHHPGELGEPDDPLPRQVPDVGRPGERQHVVLAERPHRDAAGDDELVVPAVVGERGEPERARSDELGQGGGHPFGCPRQRLDGQVDAQRLQQEAGASGRRGQVRFVDGGQHGRGGAADPSAGLLDGRTRRHRPVLARPGSRAEGCGRHLAHAALRSGHRTGRGSYRGREALERDGRHEETDVAQRDVVEAGNQEEVDDDPAERPGDDDGPEPRVQRNEDSRDHLDEAERHTSPRWVPTGRRSATTGARYWSQWTRRFGTLSSPNTTGATTNAVRRMRYACRAGSGNGRAEPDRSWSGPSRVDRSYRVSMVAMGASWSR